MDECIFCKIIKGTIPAHKVYEDEHTLAFLDIHPPLEGFTLVIPKTHSPVLWDMEQDDYQGLMSAVSKVGSRVREIMKPKRVGVQVEGLDVEHTHVKVFPFNTQEEFRALGDSNSEPNHEELALVAQKLQFD